MPKSNIKKKKELNSAKVNISKNINKSKANEQNKIEEIPVKNKNKQKTIKKNDDFDKFCKQNYLHVEPNFQAIHDEDNKDKQEIIEKILNNLNSSSLIKFSSFNPSKGFNKDSKVRQYLKTMVKEYYELFREDCDNIQNDNYTEIFKQIIAFIVNVKCYTDSTFLQCLLINSDQNSSQFYQTLKEIFSMSNSNDKDSIEKKEKILKKSFGKEKDNVSKILGNNCEFVEISEHSFKDISGLINKLNLTADNQIICNFKSNNRFTYFKDTNYEPLLNDIWINNERDESFHIKRLIVIKDIAKLNTTDFNLFISKIIEYNAFVLEGGVSVYEDDDPLVSKTDNSYHKIMKDKYSLKLKYNQTYYTNIILFDVCHDPNTLFNKLNPNLLVKLIFKNIEYTPSKYMYKEVLYKFLCTRDNLFFPKEADLEKLIFYIDNYQLSIESFQCYFKKLIEDFFLFTNWENLNYILFDRRLNQDYKELSILVNKSNTFKNYGYKDNNLIYFLIYQIMGSIFDNEVIPEEDRINLSKLLLSEYYSLLKDKNYLRDLFYCLENIISNKIKLDMILKESGKNLSNLLENENIENPNLISDLISKYSTFSTHLSKKQFSKEDFFLKFLALNMYSSDLKSFVNAKINAFIKYLINKKSKNSDEGTEKEYIDEESLFILYVFMPLFEKYVQSLDDKSSLREEINKIIIKFKKFFTEDNNQFIDVNIDNNRLSKIKSAKTENSVKIDFKMSEKSSSDIHSKFVFFLQDVLEKKKLFSFIPSIQTIHKSTKEKEKNKSYILENDIDKIDIELFNTFENLTNPAFDFNVVKDLNRMGFKVISLEEDQTIDNEDIDKIKTKTSKVNINKNKMEVELNESDEEHFTDNEEESQVYIKKSSNILDSMNSGKIYRAYLEVFAELGVEFRLKIFFIEFIKRLKISVNSAKAIEFLMLAFNKLSHEFYRLGLFHRKYMKNSDLFVKNYYDFYNYFN